MPEADINPIQTLEKTKIISFKKYPQNPNARKRKLSGVWIYVIFQALRLSLP